MSKQSETTDQYNFAGPGEYKILHGDAPPHRIKKSINIAGTLGSPHQFLIGRGPQDDNSIHLLVDNDGGRLTLVIGDTDPETTHTIKGSLSPDPNLSKFGVNTEQRWKAKDFAKFCRVMRYYFADEAQVNRLIAELQTFEGTVTRMFKEHQNPTGEQLTHLETKVEGIKMERKFNLRVPIFKGYAAHTFTVEIGIDTKSTTVDLYLFSDELYMLEPKVREDLMQSEIIKFTEYNFARVILS